MVIAPETETVMVKAIAKKKDGAWLVSVGKDSASGTFLADAVADLSMALTRSLGLKVILLLEVKA